MIDFLIYGIPWWVQLPIMAIVAAGIFLGAVALFGWSSVKGFLLPLAGAVGLLALARMLRQGGYQDRKDQEQVALDKAEKIVVKERTDVSAMPDDKLNREVDRWTRP